MKSTTYLLAFLALANRFEGVDLQTRRLWAGKWRARVIANKNQREKYRIEEWGDTAEAAAQKVMTKVRSVDYSND